MVTQAATAQDLLVHCRIYAGQHAKATAVGIIAVSINLLLGVPTRVRRGLALPNLCSDPAWLARIDRREMETDRSTHGGDGSIGQGCRADSPLQADRLFTGKFTFIFHYGTSLSIY